MIRKLLKGMYMMIPGKKVFFSLWKLFGAPPEKIFRHLYFNGSFHVSIDQQHSFRINSYGFQLENEIFWGGLYYRYEKVSLRLWAELCKQSQVIMDVGANSGLYSLVAKAMNNNACVHAFEPVDRVFEKLKQNVQLNSFDVVMIKKALSDVNGTAVIYDTDTPHQFAASLSKNVFGGNVREQLVETVTIENYVHQNNIKRIDLIKIDVERYEPEVLSGMGNCLRRMMPTMLIEIVEEENAQRIASIIQGLDYLFFDIHETTGCKLKQNLAKSSNSNWLLCSRETANLLKLPLEIVL